MTPDVRISRQGFKNSYYNCAKAYQRNLSRGRETIKKNQLEILKPKNIIYEKNSLDELNSLMGVKYE